MELENLKHLFKTAWHILKTTSFFTGEKKTTLIELPWYLVLGPEKSGKSHFILQSGLKLISTPPLNVYPHDEDELHHRCNWWCTSQAIFIDTPGNYLPKNDQHNTWKNFLDTFSPYLNKKPLSGIILTLSISDWISKTKVEQKKMATELTEALRELAKITQKVCPIYLVFTQIDQIMGFSEFFSDLSQEERHQVLGFSFNPKQFSELSLPRLFKNYFDKLIQRLNNRIVWLLHHERNHDKRALIQQFPMQLESLKTSLANFIYQLSEVISVYPNIALAGTYFVSSLQHGKLINSLEKPVMEIFGLASNITENTQPRLKQKSYFSRQLFRKVFFQSSSFNYTPKHYGSENRVRWAAYASALLLISSTGALMAHDFNNKTQQINAASTALSEYNDMSQQLPNHDEDFNQTLSTLNLAERANKLLTDSYFPWLILKINSLSDLAENTYLNALHNYYVPGLRSALERELTNSNDPAMLYGSLKLYLMLNDPSHYDPVFIKRWFQLEGPEVFSNNKTLLSQLEKHLDGLLTRPIPPVEIKPDLVAKVRQTLNAVSPPVLADTILKSDTDHTPVNFDALNTNQFKTIFTDASHLSVPKLYTASDFQSIYFDKIPDISARVLKGDWVLGTHADPNLKQNDIIGLRDQVRVLYLREYTQNWLSLINNLSVPSWKNWAQADNTLKIFLSNPSPIAQMLSVIHQNTDFKSLVSLNEMSDTDIKTIQLNLTDVFSPLNQVSEKPSVAAISDLKNYISPLEHDKNKVFALTKNRFQNEADSSDAITSLLAHSKTLPQPLQKWTEQLAQNTWRLMLDDSTRSINHSWQNTVYADYRSHLENRYPVFKNASQDIALNDFIHFFGPNQLLDRYFEDNLDAFIDRSEAQWKWRVVDNQTLNLSSDLLVQLERASIIRTMFFNQDNLKVQFSLVPNITEDLDDQHSEFTLQINGHTITDDSDDLEKHFLSWPSAHTAALASLSVTSDTGDENNLTEKGPWAFFRLLNQSHLTQTTDTQNFVLTFNLAGNVMHYKLAASKPINPFIPDIIDAFRCPESLIVE